MSLFYFFFFSSRRRHTRSLCDWSSDVCSSDLLGQILLLIAMILLPLTLFDQAKGIVSRRLAHPAIGPNWGPAVHNTLLLAGFRSEERRVGKECRSRWWPYH